MIGYLIQGFSLGLSATASPGPFQAYVIAQSVQNGWKRTLPAALAPLMSDGPIIALVLLLLTQLPAQFLRGIRIAGGFFVLYLAYMAFRAFRNFQPAGPSQNASRQSLGQAALMNFLSPGPYLFWSLIGGPTLLTGWLQAPAHGVGFLIGFYTAMVGALVLLIFLFGKAQQLGPRVSRVMLAISALAMLGFGIYQLVQGIAGEVSF